MTGTMSGSLASGHQVRMFTNTGGTHFGGLNISTGAGGTWTSQVYVGNDKADGPPTITYDICLYDIDADFRRYLDNRSDINAPMPEFPAAGTARQLDCVLVTWDRPTA